MIEATVKITACCEEDMVSLFRTFKAIQGAGERGQGRNINLFVDGDGSGRYKFSLVLPDGTTQNFKSSEQPKNTIWLGE